MTPCQVSQTRGPRRHSWPFWFIVAFLIVACCQVARADKIAIIHGNDDGSLTVNYQHRGWEYQPSYSITRYNYGRGTYYRQRWGGGWRRFDHRWTEHLGRPQAKPGWKVEPLNRPNEIVDLSKVLEEI